MQSTYTEGPPQVDGRRYVNERHADDAGRVYEFEWLGLQDAQAVLDARATLLETQLSAQREAETLVSGTLLPLTKLAFRELFTQTEREAIDAFHLTFETHPGLTAAQKATLRTGLEDYRTAQSITRPFDARVQTMISMYVALGLLSADRMAEIVEVGNG